MKKLSVISSVAVAALVLCGCSKHDSDDVAGESGDSKPLAAPADRSDADAWGAVLRDAASIEVKAGAQQPYTYFVPGGDGPDAVSRRKDEIDALKMIVEQTAVPTGRIGIGGPEADKTASVVIGAFEHVQAGRAKGLVLLVVGSSARDNELRKVVSAAGADVRIRAVK